MRYLSTPLAAILLGKSVKAFNALGLPSVGGIHRRYSIEVLEQQLGRPIDGEMIFQAEERYATRLAQWQKVNQTRRERATSRPPALDGMQAFKVPAQAFPPGL